MQMEMKNGLLSRGNKGMWKGNTQVSRSEHLHEFLYKYCNINVSPTQNSTAIWQGQILFDTYMYRI